MMRAVLAVMLVGACSSSPRPAPEPISGRAPDDGVAVANPAKPTGGHEVLGSLQRTMCFGWCPAYSITVYRDGSVEYVGEQYVKLVGKAAGHVDAATLAQLEDLFTRTHYVDFHDAYTSYDVTDSPSANTSYRRPGGALKTIAHYYGDTSAPAALTELETQFDTIVHIDQWIGTEAERQKLAGH